MPTKTRPPIPERRDNSEVLEAIDELKSAFNDFRVFYTREHEQVKHEASRANERIDLILDPTCGRIPKIEADVKTLMALVPFVKALTVLSGIIIPAFVLGLLSLLWLLLTHQIEIVQIVSRIK